VDLLPRAARGVCMHVQAGNDTPAGARKLLTFSWRPRPGPEASVGLPGCFLCLECVLAGARKPRSRRVCESGPGKPGRKRALAWDSPPGTRLELWQRVCWLR
jgi:hypothetical protein